MHQPLRHQERFVWRSRRVAPPPAVVATAVVAVSLGHCSVCGTGRKLALLGEERAVGRGGCTARDTRTPAFLRALQTHRTAARRPLGAGLARRVRVLNPDTRRSVGACAVNKARCATHSVAAHTRARAVLGAAAERVGRRRDVGRGRAAVVFVGTSRRPATESLFKKLSHRTELAKRVNCSLLHSK